MYRENNRNITYLLQWCYVFIIIFVAHGVMYAQDNSDEMFYILEDYVDDENFEGAIKLYKRVLDEDPNNPEINFKLGFCYLNTPHQKSEAIRYFGKSVKYYSKRKRRRRKKRLEYLESSFYLAKAYQANYKFDTAIYQYNQLKEKVKNKKLLGIIEREILKSAKSKALLIDSVELSITNLGETINSEYSDHSPLVTVDQSVLMFTSRRANKYNHNADMEGEYDENIYISHADENGEWTKPQSIGDSINTSEHEAVIGLSADGQQLLLYKSEDKGSIYISTLKGDVWSKPKKLGKHINTRNRETHASISADGKKLYFTSDRKGGYGGLDIYCAYKKDDGTWGDVKNLGSSINTDKDERAPYIHPDGVTMYFSSKGLGGLGGFDIFTTQMNDSSGTWSKPKNIGYPINTSSDDIYYIGTADGKRAYYTSSQKGGFGRTDLYRIDFKKSKIAHKLTVITGKFSVSKGKLPPVSITVLNAETNKVVGVYLPNSKTGKFLFVLSKGKKYKMIFKANDKIIKEETLIVSEDSAYQQLYKIIKIPDNVGNNESTNKKTTLPTDNVNEKIVLPTDSVDKKNIIYDTNIEINNILFPSSKSSFSYENKSLNQLAKYLRENPNAIIEIGAYADSRGNAIYNYKLSVKRAKAAKDYLIKRNVKPKQIVAIGYGEENPITINKNKNGRWNYMGRKYNRRIEFRIIKQGKKTLQIKPIMNIPKKLLNKNYNKNYIKNMKKHIEVDT